MEFPFRIGHRRTRALLSSYVDGEVSAADVRRVEEHAAACSECRDELESLTATVELVRALPDLELPRSFELTMLPEEEPRASFGVWAPRLATSVAGLLLVALLAGDLVGTLTQAGGFDDETSAAMDMQSDAPPPPMAQAFEAPAAAAPQAAAAPPMAAQAAPTQAVELMSADAEDGTPEASEAAPAPPAAPATARGLARKSDAQPATPEAVADTPAAAMKAHVQTAAQPSPELPTAASKALVLEQPGPPGAPAPKAVLDDGAETAVWAPSDEADAIGVPLRELQVAAAVCFLALAAVTVWRARRRRRRV